MSRASSAHALLIVLAAALACACALPLGSPSTTETGHANPQDHGTPVGQNSYNKDPAVQELEKLKSLADDVRTLSIVKTQSDFMKNDNGEESEQHHSHQAVEANGKLVAHVAHHETKGAEGDARWSELDVPGQGQGVQRVLGHDHREHDAKDIQGKAYSGAARLIQPSMAMSGSHILEQTNNGNRRGFNADIKQELNNNMDHFSSYTGVQYSPLDMAEYIFWTGDERGVTLAIEEFLQDGLMSRDEAIAFLQEIKYNMEYLQTHYAGTGGALRGESNKDLNFPYGFSGLNSAPLQSRQPFTGNGILKAIANKNYELNNNIVVGMPSLPVSNMNVAAMSPMSAVLPVSMVDLRQETIKRSMPDPMLQTNIIGTPDVERDSSPMISEEEYEEIIEKLRVADSIYTEYSLEEVIYQLAKVMFAQSLSRSRGTDEARAAAQRFASFLQLQVEQGRISRALQKKVMDVLMTALSDTLAADRPQWMSAARDDLAAGLQAPHGNRLLKQFVEYGAADQPLSKGILEAYREEISKEQANNKLMEHHQWMKAQETPMSEQKRATMAEPKFGHNM